MIDWAGYVTNVNRIFMAESIENVVTMKTIKGFGGKYKSSS
jgi:hypothetical protein